MMSATQFTPLVGTSSILAAYLLGAVSFSYLIVRALRGIDIRTVGSGNAGATNVLRVAGKLPALLALVLDVGKGAAAVVALRSLGAPVPWVAAAAVAAVVGHVFPVYMAFRGGKGVATALGTLAVLTPRPTLLLVALFVVLVAATRYVSLGSVCVAVAGPLVMLLGGRLGWLEPGETWPYFFASALIGGVIVVKHRANLRRLFSGEESKLGERAAAKAGAG